MGRISAKTSEETTLKTTDGEHNGKDVREDDCKDNRWVQSLLFARWSAVAVRNFKVCKLPLHAFAFYQCPTPCSLMSRNKCDGVNSELVPGDCSMNAFCMPFQTKLDSYQSIQTEGGDLNQDQKVFILFHFQVPLFPGVHHSFIYQ